MKKILTIVLALAALNITAYCQQSNQINDQPRKAITFADYLEEKLRKVDLMNSTDNKQQVVPDKESTFATNNAKSVVGVPIGSAANIFTQLIERCRTVDALPSLNAVSFIHRNNGNLFGGPSSLYRYDISTDGGLSFTSDIGPLNPATPGANVPNGQGRYPQGVMYSPDNTTANGLFIYQGATHDGVSAVVWDGFTAGSATLTTGANTTQTDYNIPSGVIPNSLTRGLPGEFWSVDVHIPDNTGNTTDMVLYKGTLSGNNVSWQIAETFTANIFTQDAGNSVASDPVIAFSNDGLTGYALVPGSLSNDVGNISHNPIYWMTEDGGVNWKGPHTMNLDKLGGAADDFANVNNSVFTPTPVPGPLSITGAGTDIVVDKDGNLHVGTLIESAFFDINTNAFLPFTWSLGNQFVVDLIYNKANNDWSMIWPDINIGTVSQIVSFRDTVIIDGNFTSDVRLHISKDEAEEKIFITYGDDVAGLGAGANNTHRDLYGWGYDVNTNKTTDVRNLTLPDPVFYGNAYFHSVAPNVFENGGTYTIPTVFTEPTDPFNQLAPVNFWYYQDATFVESDFAFDPTIQPVYAGVLPTMGTINEVVNGCDIDFTVVGADLTSLWSNDVIWCYGDGVFEVADINNTVTHTFPAPGQYTVLVCGDNEDGFECAEIVVEACQSVTCTDPVFAECVNIALACESNSIYVVQPGSPDLPLTPGSDWIFEWSLDGNLVHTATGVPYYSPSEIGNYTVVVTDPTLCVFWDSSDPCGAFTVNEIIDCTNCD